MDDFVTQNTTPVSINKDHELCECKQGVILGDSHLDIEIHKCGVCKRIVADAEEFFNVPVEIFSK